MKNLSIEILKHENGLTSHKNNIQIIIPNYCKVY